MKTKLILHVFPASYFLTLLLCSVFGPLASAQTCVDLPSGVVSWWRGEGNYLDQAGTNSGAGVGNVSFASSKVGEGFVLDGNGDAINLGNPTNLQTQAFTIEAWIKRASSTRATQGAQSSGYVLSGGTGGYGFGLLDDGRVFLTKVGFSAVFSTGMIVDSNNFHHVAVTKTGDEVVLYIDGVGESAGPYDPGFVFTGSLAIGARGGDYASSFFGNIDEVTIYNRALATNEIQGIVSAGGSGKCVPAVPPNIISQPTNQTVVQGATASFSVTATGTESLYYQWRFNSTNIAGATATTLSLTNVQFANAGNYSVVVSNIAGVAVSSNAVLTVVSPPPPCAPPAAGLIAWWRAENDGLDSIGTNHGVLESQVSYSVGRVGSAFQFGGHRDGVQLGNPTNLHLQTFTIEGWIKRSSSTDSTLDNYSDGCILHFGPGGYGFAIWDDGKLLLTKVGSSAVTSSQSIQDTSFHHVAVTKTGSEVRFYLDGVGELVGPYDPGFTFNMPVAIGAQGGDLAATFFGAIDELGVYNRALGSNEIQSIYNAGSYGKCAPATAPTILTHPRSTNVVVGSNISFSVIASGSPNPDYQWRFNGTNIAGATTSLFALTNVQFAHEGNYSVVVTNSAGSATSSNALLSMIGIVRALGTNVMAGQTFDIPVTLTARGNENGLGFSLGFDAQRLSYAGVVPGSGAAGATMLVNTNMAAGGKVGIAVAFPPEGAFALGTREVVRVRLRSLPLLGGSPVNSSVSFGDEPVLRQLYDNQLQTIAVQYSGDAVTLNPIVFEGDVHPRPNGNQAVTTTDWAQAGRFVARLDQAANGAEFQRADTSPRTLLGDGYMKVTDWVQTGRYLAGLDSLAAIGGPANEVPATGESLAVSRQLRVTSTNAIQGNSAMVAVMLEAQGDENALGFTLSFDPAAMVFQNVAPGSGDAGASLTVNSTQAGAGRLGIVLALPTGTAFSVGSKELVRVTFAAQAEAIGTVGLNLTDLLVTRCVSDAYANELPANYVNGLFTINSATPPELRIEQASTNVIVSWPVWAADFALQTWGGTNDIQSGWTNIPVVLQTNGENVSVDLPIQDGVKFFRLFRP